VTAAAGGPTIQPSAYDAVRARKVDSDGLAPDADTPLTSDLVEWADIIFVMEKAHRTKLAPKFKNSLNGQRVVCLNVPDRTVRGLTYYSTRARTRAGLGRFPTVN
jgi:predicted protein tyrosine phosphatase